MNKTTLPAKLNLPTNYANSKEGKIVIASKQLKIRDLEPENDEPIKQVLRYVFTLVGIRADQIPDEIQKAVLIDFIRAELQNFTLPEFKIAFTMAVKGDLNVDPNPFGQFSALYLSNILKAYQEEKNKAMIKERQRIREAEERERNRPLTPEEQAKVHEEFDQKFIIEPFDEYIKTGKFEVFKMFPSVLFDALRVRHGKIKLSKKDIEALRSEAKFEIRTESQKENGFCRTIKDVQKSSINIKMKQIAVRNFVEAAKKRGETAKTLLK